MTRPQSGGGRPEAPWPAELDPFDAAQKLAALWGSGGDALLEAQRRLVHGIGSFATEASRTGRMVPEGGDAAAAALAQSWATALGVSAAVKANVGEGGGPELAAILDEVLDPGSWFPTGAGAPGEPRSRVANEMEGRSADVAATWAALWRCALELAVITSEAWMQAVGAFARALAAAGRHEPAEVRALWAVEAERALAETRRSDSFKAGRRKLVAAARDLRRAQDGLGEVLGVPGRGVAEDLRGGMAELRREMTALSRALGLARRAGPAAGESVVWRRGAATLTHLPPADEPGLGPVLLLASPLPAAAGPDTVGLARTLRDRGFDTYLGDWGRAGDAERWLTLADHADYAGEMAEAASAASDGRLPALVGIGDAGLLVSAVAAARPDELAALALVEAQLDFGVPAAERPPEWGAALAEADELLDVIDLLPADLLGPALEEMGGLGAVTPGAPDGPSRGPRCSARTRAALLSDLGRELRRENTLVRGRLQIGRDLVDLSRVECPVATLASEGDPHRAASCRALGHLVASEDYTDLALASGPDRAGELGAALADWLAPRL
jgi:hypothetical protein